MCKNFSSQSSSSNAGFNLVELLLAISIIAILTTIATPNILSFFELQKSQEETSTMETLKKGLHAYAQDNSSLPEVATAVDELVRYTGYFPRQISTNSWGTSRVYTMLPLQQNYRNASFLVYYAVIVSLGADGCLTVGGTDYCSSGDIDTQMASLIDDGSDTTTLFDGLAAEGDDVLIKYTDFKNKAENYEITTRRLNNVATALAIYAKTQRFQGVQDGEVDAEQKIYFPPSDDSWPTLDSVDDLYGVNVIADTNSATELVDVVEPSISNGADIEERLSDMVALMKVLGLPDSNCCNAMSKVDHDISATTPNVEEPFYYYANPRSRLVTNPVNSGDCFSAEVPNLTDFRNPPRITVTPDVCGTN